MLAYRSFQKSLAIFPRVWDDTAGNLMQVTYLVGTPNAIRVRYTYNSTYNQITSYTNVLGRTSSKRVAS